MVDKFAEAGNTMMVTKFNVHNIDDGREEMSKYFKSPLRDKAMHQLGIGTMHMMKSVITGVFFPFMASKYYTFMEKINFWRAKFFLLNKTKLIEELFSIDLTVKVPKLEIPVYFFSGIHDFTVNYTLSKEYLKSLDAPLKGFYSFNSSAHSPMFEEPGRFNHLLKNDVLEGKNSLGDPL
jgi:pimeloyl-ACP methyl ester carboxylesterase